MSDSMVTELSSLRIVKKTNGKPGSNSPAMTSAWWWCYHGGVARLPWVAALSSPQWVRLRNFVPELRH